MNSHASNPGLPFEHGAISEEELENVVGGLARAWIEPLAPAPTIRDAPRDPTSWASQAGALDV